jgi:hypothetical protein
MKMIPPKNTTDETPKTILSWRVNGGGGVLLGSIIVFSYEFHFADTIGVSVLDCFRSHEYEQDDEHRIECAGDRMITHQPETKPSANCGTGKQNPMRLFSDLHLIS